MDRNRHARERNSCAHAVVIGGSIAGLLAARVLLDFFDQVVLIERDLLPRQALSRAGVPQARHVHVLMQRGQQVIEHLFPGYQEDLVANGAMTIDVTEEMAWLNPAGWTPRRASGLNMLACSRDLMEWGVRHRVLNQRRVKLLEEVDVVGLTASRERDRVIGVQVRSRHDMPNRSAGIEVIEADLVVDASGRTSKSPRLLAELGYPLPEETVINAHLGYASRIYEIPSGFQPHWKALYIQSAPPGFPRGGEIFPIEDGRWLVSLTGGGGEYPPKDNAGFLGFAGSLRTPLLYEAIQNATPLTSIHSFRNAENRRRHFDRMKRWPDNFVVTGDAACTFNPVYGQGMTIAALEAMLLQNCLREQNSSHADRGLRGFARRFQRALGQLIEGSWLLATGEDFRYLGAQGGSRGKTLQFAHWYLDQVFRLATEDFEAVKLFAEVEHMLKPPGVLFSPRIVLAVMKQILSKRPLHRSRALFSEQIVGA